MSNSDVDVWKLMALMTLVMWKVIAPARASDVDGVARNGNRKKIKFLLCARC